jgi:hypothetical protein
VSVADLYARVPRLETSRHRITSPPTDRYNCVAWVYRDFERWWEPGFYWPEYAPMPVGDEDLDAYVRLFAHAGFRECETPDFETGYLKIAIYARDGRFHHVAKQLPSDAWSSKVGKSVDLRHEQLDALYDCAYWNKAEAVVFMKRPYDDDPYEIEETGLI